MSSDDGFDQLPEPIPHIDPQPPTAEAAVAEDWWAKPAVRRGTTGAAIAVFLLMATVLALTLHKPSPHPRPHADDVAQAPSAGEPAVPALVATTATPAVALRPPDAIPERMPARIVAPAPREYAIAPGSPSAPTQPSPANAPASPTSTAQASSVEAPAPRPASPRSPQTVTYDRFGNPVGPEMGLGRDYEFKGKKLLFWSGYENAGHVFFGRDNPLWKAWEKQGFTVRIEFGRFRTEWLRDLDQLWVLSTARYESPIPAGVPPELVVGAVDLLPAAAIPSGFTRDEYKFIVRATLDMALSRVHPLDEAACREIVKFVQSGKGLCLLSDDEPYTAESNELVHRLYGVTVKGNYIADKIAHVRNRGLTPADIRKYGGQYEVADHPLLTGVNFLYEGITISNVGVSDKLEVALRASDGQPLVALSRVPGQRVVIDCAFTQLCHGPTARTSYILKSAGAVRLAQNIAAYLAGKDLPPVKKE